MSGSANTALWLIGIGVLALTGWWWPGIIFLAAVSALGRRSFYGFLWLAGIGLLAYLDAWWPGLLILAGLAILSRAIQGWMHPDEIPEEDRHLEPEEPHRIENPAKIPGPAPDPSPENLARSTSTGVPDNCPACGGPLTETTIDRRGRQAYCGFCGTQLQSIERSG